MVGEISKNLLMILIDLADAGLTFLLLEDLAESIPVWELSLIIEFLESRGSSLVTVSVNGNDNVLIIRISLLVRERALYSSDYAMKLFADYPNPKNLLFVEESYFLYPKYSHLGNVQGLIFVEISMLKILPR